MEQFPTKGDNLIHSCATMPLLPDNILQPIFICFQCDTFLHFLIGRVVVLLGLPSSQFSNSYSECHRTTILSISLLSRQDVRDDGVSPPLLWNIIFYYYQSPTRLIALLLINNGFLSIGIVVLIKILSNTKTHHQLEY